MNAVARWWSRRLSSRIVALFLGGLLAVQLASLVVVNASIANNARVLLSQDLAVGERIWARLLAQRAAQLTLGASVLAADYGFRAATASGDIDTLRSALANHGERIGATVSAMLAPDLSVRALGENTQPAAFEALRPLARTLAERGSALALVAGQPYQLVMVPMKAPLLVGYIVMGFALDADLAADMRAVSGLHVAVLLKPAKPAERAKPAEPGEPGQGAEKAVLSTLSEAATRALVASPQRGEEVLLAGSDHVLRSIAHVNAVAGGASLRTVLLRSVAEAVAP